MKAILLVGPGANQCALAHRLHAAAPLSHIAHVAIPPPPTRRKWVRSIVSATLARGLRNAWAALMVHYDARFPGWPDIPASTHHGVNADTVLQLIAHERPDLVLVSGTDLLRSPLIEAIKDNGAVINLHTGLSPFIKGGPNCTNWALALGEFDLIGNTILWLDTGIDSGAVIATERTPLTGRETLAELHIAVMDHAHELFVRAWRRFAAGLALPAVPQRELGKGRLFLNKHWNSRAMLNAVRNFALGYGPSALVRSRPVTLVRLDPPTG